MFSCQGPLKAVYKSPIQSFYTSQNCQSSEKKNIPRKTNTLPNSFFASKDSQSVKNSLENKLPPSVATASLCDATHNLARTSTLKSVSNWHEMREDIRRHFPACRSTLQLKSAEVIDTLHSSLTPDCYTYREEQKTACVNVKRVFPEAEKGENSDEIPCACCTNTHHPEQSAFSWTRLHAVRSSPRMLTMGSGVKYHQRHFRRLSAAEDTRTGIQAEYIGDDYVNLAPVCPVPIPSAFENVERGTKNICSLSQIAVETQTSPGVLNSSWSPSFRRSTRTRRRSGAKMIHKIKKSIDSLRRAVSADRSVRSSIGGPTEFVDSISPTILPIKPDILANLKSNRLQSKSSISPKHKQILGDVQYFLLQKYSDRSYRVQCKRVSTNTPFGFYIARNAQGLFVSRINSADYLVKMRNLIHVGDRILEVQGIPCKNLDIPTVTGFLRGCHIATFKIKSGKLPTIKNR